MKKVIKLNLSVAAIIFAITYAAYYLLLYDNCLHTSISSIIQSSNTMPVKSHLLVLGLLPIYIAFMIFGAAVLGIYLGSAVQQLLARTQKNK